MAKKYKATLVRGNSYMVRGKTFTNGIPLTVTEDDKEYMEKTAIDVLTMLDSSVPEGKTRREEPKFTFEEASSKASEKEVDDAEDDEVDIQEEVKKVTVKKTRGRKKAQ